MKVLPKERLLMRNKTLINRAVFIISLLFIFTVNAQSQNVTLSGDFIQGGLIVGNATKPIEKASIDDVKVPIHPNTKLFAFGFGRDAKAQSVFKISYKDGTQEQLNLDIVQREYKVDKVNGVASKYVSPPESVLKRIRNDSAIVKQARAGLSFRTDFTNSVTKPAQGRTSGVYGSQRVFNGVPKRPHFGLDIAAKTGTKVIAPWSGKVMLAEPDLYYSGGTLIIDHGMGITTTYIHLSALHVKAGDVLEQGQLIAEIGATGRVTGPHLDWRLNWFNRRLDPQLLLP